MLSLSLPMLTELRQQAHAQQSHVVELLKTQHGLSDQDALQQLANVTHFPTQNLASLQQATPAFELIAYADALAHHCAAIRDDTGQLALLLTDPFDAACIMWAEQQLSEPAPWYLITPAEMTALLRQWERTERAVDRLDTGSHAEDNRQQVAASISLTSIAGESSAAVKLVDSTIYDALMAGASDIHIEVHASGLCIRYRLDGVLTQVKQLSGIELAEQAISRLKVMSELDIAERRIPQDGRFKAIVSGREIDFRVSIMPSAFGEDAVLRVLDKQALASSMEGLRLESLGFDPDMRHAIRRLSKEPYGMLLVTGPTGSGKSTTLYAAIGEINTGEDKIITIEDPIEYQLPGVLQIPVNEKKGLTFSRGLRSILRHDPDKILVGEIRDADTAQIAVQAALTGHLVFTTVHANNVFDVLGRFTHMGVDAYNFVSALNGIVAQRLVRVLCTRCATLHQPDADLLTESGLDGQDLTAFRFMRGQGCGECRGTGYKGRKAIAELLQFSDSIRELIISRAPVTQLKEAATQQGYQPLRMAAMDMVKQGLTSLQEINRVTFVA
ncbi:GspE/PulE family protein [Chitinivorax sp. B]|uniref:GspE/PulE family protein n=1 Tax=Chitinivorax sp. B TaxID=2502235 RepID=UPI0010FA35CE|nr:GspE/PulE family protein [Chitinivorax sp. B]